MYPQLPCLREYFALEGIADKHINNQQLQLRQDAGGTSGQITDATKEANNLNDFAGGALVSELNRLKARLGLTGSFHINSLIRQACDEAVYGYGFTFEGDRFLPATVPHRIENGFAYGVGIRRTPLTGIGFLGDGIVTLTFPFDLVASDTITLDNGAVTRDDANDLVTLDNTSKIWGIEVKTSAGVTRARYECIDSTGTNVIDNSGNGDDATLSSDSVWTTGETFGSYRNETGYALSSDLANIFIPLLADKLTPAFTTNITDTFTGKVAQRLKMTGGACLNPNLLNHGSIASGFNYAPHNKPITGFIKAEGHTVNQKVIGLGDLVAAQDFTFLQIPANLLDLEFILRVAGSNEIQYRWEDAFTEGQEIEFELTPVLDGAVNNKAILKIRTDLTIPFSEISALTPLVTLDNAVSTGISYDEAHFFGRDNDTQEVKGECGRVVFNDEPARTFYFEEQDGSSKSADGTRTVVFSNNAIWGGTMDLHGYNTERLGGNKATLRFVAQAIDSNNTPTGLDLDGNTIANLAMLDTGLELDGTFDSTPELDGATATMITDIDLDFTYINSNVNPIDYLKDLLFFLVTTIAGYPAGERAKILTFTDNNP